MSTYRHYLSGFFTHRDQAEIALTRLTGKGFPRTRVQIFDSQSPPIAHKSADGSNEVLKDVLVDSALGTAVGLTIGGLGEVALVAANVTLFVASPLIAPLVMGTIVRYELLLHHYARCFLFRQQYRNRIYL